MASSRPLASRAPFSRLLSRQFSQARRAVMQGARDALCSCSCSCSCCRPMQALHFYPFCILAPRAMTWQSSEHKAYAPSRPLPFAQPPAHDLSSLTANDCRTGFTLSFAVCALLHAAAFPVTSSGGGARAHVLTASASYPFLCAGA